MNKEKYEAANHNHKCSNILENKAKETTWKMAFVLKYHCCRYSRQDAHAILNNNIMGNITSSFISREREILSVLKSLFTRKTQNAATQKKKEIV